MIILIKLVKCTQLLKQCIANQKIVFWLMTDLFFNWEISSYHCSNYAFQGTYCPCANMNYFNSCVGKEHDFVAEIDNLPKRVVIEIMVKTVSDTIALLDLQGFVEGRVSDHSLLRCTCRMSNDVPTSTEGSSTGVTEHEAANHNAPIQDNQDSRLQATTTASTHMHHSSTDDVLPCHNVDKLPTNYRIKSVPSKFLSNSDNARKCLEWFEQITESRLNQEVIDNQNKEFTTILESEIKIYLKPIQSAAKSNKYLRHS